ncbi:MAG: Fur family transcriptional regulator [Acidobacteriota bacterium]
MRVDTKEIDRRIKAFTAKASEAGVKLTHQRLEIFREVAASAEHPDAEEILNAVKPRMPTVSLDTVYRTLWLLGDLGLVTTLGPRRQSVRFDANLRNHHHFVCDRCGMVRDFESAEFDRIRVPAAVRALGTAVRAQVEIRGICEQCNKHQRRKKS